MSNFIFHAGTIWQDVLHEFRYSDDAHIREIVELADSEINERESELSAAKKFADDILNGEPYDDLDYIIGRAADDIKLMRPVWEWLQEELIPNGDTLEDFEFAYNWRIKELEYAAQGLEYDLDEFLYIGDLDD